MKRTFVSLFTLMSILLLGSCASEVAETITYKVNEPIFMSTSDFRNSVKVVSPKESIEQQGKIAFFKNYLYLSEPEKGIHIIDNSNPSNPEMVGFIELIGNVDLAIKDDILYADSYIDMVWFDISNPSKPKLLGREQDVFPDAIPNPENPYPCDYNPYNKEKRAKGIVIGWQTTTKTETYMRERDWSLWETAEKSDAFLSNSPTNSNIGKTGSMSRFAIYKKYLYTVKKNRLGVFDIAEAQPKKAIEDIYVGWNVETIFSYKDNMFMGTPTGMIIYSVKNPLKPQRMSSITHVYGCDPIVVENDIAYVTVHSGNNCGQNNNQLIIIDVKDVTKPKVMVSYQMTKPKGLAIDNNTLFVCDDGLKVFNAKKPLEIMVENNLLAHFKDIAGYDVIAYNNLLMMIGEDGIYQYDYKDIKGIKQLSFIPIAN